MQANPLGQEFYESLSDAVVVERSGWVFERITRVRERLTPLVGDFEIVVPWLDGASAFTLPGRYIYITRQLFELCKNDDMVAFIVAHEVAHHDLGHIREFPKWMRSKAWLMMGAHLFHRLVLARHHSKNESDADAYAIDLCAEAKYDVNECARVFDILAKISLDLGDVDSVVDDNPLYPSINQRKKDILHWHQSLHS